MAKPSLQSPQEAVAAQARDWFMPAIESAGTVAQSLDAVLDELSRRVTFIQALRANLDRSLPRGTDAVTDLGHRIRALENTLRFRLGILRPDRPAAWFRAPAAQATGPFSSTVLEEPVFGPYEARDAERVQGVLAEAWQTLRASGLPFKDASSCLWRTLLTLNVELERVAQLPAPYEEMRLDQLPDDLLPALESRALRAFLLNVRSEMQAARLRLDACHAQLLEASERLWAYQLEQERAERLRAAPGPKTSGPRVRAGSPADDLREELKRRRAATGQLRAFLSPTDVEALQVMGFDELPSVDALRQRYIAMAKRLHPDLQGGSDQGFKRLASAYSHLASRVERSF